MTGPVSFYRASSIPFRCRCERCRSYAPLVIHRDAPGVSRAVCLPCRDFILMLAALTLANAQGARF